MEGYEILKNIAIGPRTWLFLRFFRNVSEAFIKPIAAEGFWPQSAPGNIIAYSDKKYIIMEHKFFPNFQLSPPNIFF
jgi:hypothetical protein